MIETISLVKKHGSVAAAAKAAGINRTTLGSRYKQAKDQGLLERVENECELQTALEVMEYAGIDPDKYEPQKIIANRWGNSAEPNWQCKVTVRRKITETQEQVFDALCERMQEHAPKYPKIKRTRLKDPHLLVMDLFDVHFGKLAWEPETGQNYDLKIAEKLFANAVEDLMRKANGYEIGQVLIPLGHDFFHIDNRENTTTAGTPQDVEGRYAKIIETGEMAVIRAIESLLTVAPVHVMYIPGNHDTTTSYHLSRSVAMWFRHCPDVTVDYRPASRKYYEWGKNLIGSTHADKGSWKSLSNIMPVEQPQAWSRTICHEWHLGHTHTSKKVEFLGTQEMNGLVFRWMHSLSRTDAWHFNNMYIGNRQAAEAHLYHHESGYNGGFPAVARA